MAHFYSEIQGGHGEATRVGTKKSGIRGHIRGWNSGIAVYGYVNENGEDEFEVRLTSGSKGYKSSKLIGRFSHKDLD